jgi:hypothetical protein
VLVEDVQQGSGEESGLLGGASQLGNRGSALQQDREKAAYSGKADAFGLGDGGELGLFVRIEEDGVRLLVAEALLGLAEAFPEVVDLLLEVVDLPLSV